MLRWKTIRCWSAESGELIGMMALSFLWIGLAAGGDEQQIVDKNKVPPRPLPELAGEWKSNLGSVVMTQKEKSVQGRLRFENGAIAEIKGEIERKIDGDFVVFTWGLEGQKLGGGTLKVHDGGKRLVGNYTDDAKNTSGVFDLARVSTGKLDLSGDWSSNLGGVAFTQKDKSVTGRLRFSNGVVAEITGTMKSTSEGDVLQFAWSIGGQPMGRGTLKVMDGGKSLVGEYRDDVQKSSGPFRLTRAK